jgi:predicted Fe-Mo cluster-binding NifX family protein
MHKKESKSMMTFKTTDNKATQYKPAFQRFANKEKATSEAIRKMLGVKGKALLVVGTIDQTARKALEAKGWKIEERFREKRLREMVAKAMSK